MLDKAVAVILPVTVKVVPSNVKLEFTLGSPLSYVTIPSAVVPLQFIFKVLSVIKEPPPERPVPAMMETYVPEEPTLPEIPEEPEVPEEPDEAELPEEADEPLEPEEPDEPLDPEDPDELEEPEVPDVPDAPDEPEAAEIPLTPEVPVEPEVAAEPAEPL